MTSSLAVIILNYRRPQNIGAIARDVRQALPDAPIFVLDQAETDTLRARTDIRWSDIWFQRAEANRGAGARVPLAAAMPFDHYLAIDDDTFLTPQQIARLVELLRAEPDRAHGIWGRRLEFNDGAVTFRNFMIRLNAPVSILNRVYAFSRAQATAAIDLSARLGFASWHDIGAVDDVLLSCASAKPPLLHDLGDIVECPTSNETGIAVWKGDGYNERCAEVTRQLIAAQAIAVFSPLVYK